MMPRSFSGKDIRFSLWQQGFDSPTGYHYNNIIIGEVPERPKGSDCKSDGSAFEGSNPSLTTIITTLECKSILCGFFFK